MKSILNSLIECSSDSVTLETVELFQFPMQFFTDSHEINNFALSFPSLESDTGPGSVDSEFGVENLPVLSTIQPDGELSPFMNLTDWQFSQLKGLSAQGIECLLQNWISEARNPITHPHCNATWDDIYCWPPALAGDTIRVPCSVVMKDDFPHIDSNSLTADAYRVCTEDAVWLWGNWTNYNDCMTSIEVLQQHDTLLYKLAVTYSVFFGSILSLLSLCAALFIFYKFRSLRCDRVIIHMHLMVALAIRFLLLIIIAEPFVFQRENNYRSLNWLCKKLLALQLYAQVASVNWMFIQGHYLHSKLTSSVFDGSVPLIPYCIFGWGKPLILIIAWAVVLEIFHEAHCWKGYGPLPYNWIVNGPMIFVLFVNMIFLLNIIRILCSKMQVNNGVSEPDQFRRLAKATIVLFPLLGLNNLLFFYSPGPDEPYHLVYLICNSVLQSSQGIFVAFFYCFLSKDVKDTLRREYSRFWARRRPNRDCSLRNAGSGTGRNQSWRTSYRDRLMKRNRRSTESQISLSYMGAGCQHGDRERVITVTIPERVEKNIADGKPKTNADDKEGEDEELRIG